MHLFESITPGAMIAPVGQASIQRVQVPHDIFEGLRFGFNGRFVKITARKIHDPNSGEMRQEFLPMNPKFACSANARSRTGPVST